MKKNMGTIDKAARLIVAALIVILYFTQTISGTLGIVLLIFAGVFVLTSLVSFCPFYPILKINTSKSKI